MTEKNGNWRKPTETCSNPRGNVEAAHGGGAGASYPGRSDGAQKYRQVFQLGGSYWLFATEPDFLAERKPPSQRLLSWTTEPCTWSGRHTVFPANRTCTLLAE